MTALDMAIMGVIALSMLISIQRGFIREAISLVAWMAAFFISRLYGPAFANLLVEFVRNDSVRLPLAHFTLFLGILLLGSLVSLLLKMLLKAAGLSVADRLLGSGFGLARGVLIVVIVIAAMEWLGWFKEVPWWKDSVFLPHFSAIEAWCKAFLKNFTGYTLRT